MTKLITILDLKQLIVKHGLKTFYQDLILYLREDFTRWNQFHKTPRIAAPISNGLIELMPIWDDHYYSYKYVNGHPGNTTSGHLTVVALGCLADVKTGYPLLLSEITLLTGIRTASTSALATDLLAKNTSSPNHPSA